MVARYTIQIDDRVGKAGKKRCRRHRSHYAELSADIQHQPRLQRVSDGINIGYAAVLRWVGRGLAEQLRFDLEFVRPAGELIRTGERRHKVVVKSASFTPKPVCVEIEVEARLAKIFAGQKSQLMIY